MNIQNENEKGMFGSTEKEQRENPNLDEKLPEFDLNGTALNDI